MAVVYMLALFQAHFTAWQTEVKVPQLQSQAAWPDFAAFTTARSRNILVLIITQKAEGMSWRTCIDVLQKCVTCHSPDCMWAE